ncbi:MAG: phosphocholine cytidylyltransferase family protein [Elusimicrobiota bacterium]|nr:MAG: phosphocholine cytidylyltransferase family protein [Elusimicrobiota bacterium]
MRAVVLAAGRGSRLQPHTDDTPKGLLDLGGTTLAARTVGILRRLGVKDISFVVGYRQDSYRKAFPSGIKFYENPDWESTDQAGSLLKARAEFADGLLVITGDLFCPESVYAGMLSLDAPAAVAIDRSARPFDDTIEKVRLEKDSIVRIGKLNVSDAEANAEFLGMSRFSRAEGPAAVRRLEAAVAANPRKAALIHAHQALLDEKRPLAFVECRGPWCEVDDLPSLEKARRYLAAPAA